MSNLTHQCACEQCWHHAVRCESPATITHADSGYCQACFDELIVRTLVSMQNAEMKRLELVEITSLRTPPGFREWLKTS
jgi:hypothetical protein